MSKFLLWFNRVKQEGHLTYADRFEAEAGIKGLLSTIFLLTVLMLALFVWASFIEIEEAASALGEIVTKTPVQIIQHLEGGIIKEIKVKNGDQVQKDQLIAKLDPTVFLSELEEMQMREISLLFDAERLRAYSHGQELPLREILQRAIAKLSPRSRNAIQSMIDEEEILLRIQRASKSDQKAILESQLAQNLEELNQLTGQKDIVNKQIALLEEERDMYSKMRKKEYFSKRDFLKIRREINEAHGELHRLVSNIKQTEQKLKQGRNRLNELSSNLSQHAAAELGKVTSELLEVQRKIEKLQDKVKRTDLKSIVSGTVQGMEVIVGSVISPGQQLMKIIPKNSELIARVRIKPKDRGHIDVGDKVNIKVSTYDFPRYGAVQGTLKTISASTFKDPQENDPYYIGEVILKKQYVGQKQYPLLPGMSAEADIITGHKTLLEYLLKPIHLTLSASFKER